MIQDPVTGKKKMQGTFHNAGPLDMVQGVIVGEVFAEGSGAGETRSAPRPDRPLAGHYGENGTITAQIGGANAPDTRFPASISSGKWPRPVRAV